MSYVHFEKTYTLKTHVAFFESVYCELLEKTYTLNTSKSVYSVHVVQSFGLWRGMCPGFPVDTISVFRVESVRHGREINYQPSKLLCYVHFEKNIHTQDTRDILRIGIL